VRGQSLDSFADLEQPDPYRIEDEAVIQGAALEVSTDCVNGGLNIG
jgi:hypothetical protein